MTDKRFTLRLTHKDNGVKIFDNLDENNWRILALSYVDYEDTKYIKAKLEPVVELLNELHEENQDLKSFNKDLAENLSVCANARISKDNWIEKLSEENEQLKEQIKELYKMVKYDVDNEIEVYPKTLAKYLVNILKIIGDVE